MAKNKDLAATLIDDYASLGLGERLDDYTIRALDGSSTLELDSIEDAENGENVGIEVVVDDVSVAEVMYDDEKFSEKILDEVKSALNI